MLLYHKRIKLLKEMNLENNKENHIKLMINKNILRGRDWMSEYKCNHCKKITKHNGSYTEIGFIEIPFKYTKNISSSVLYHEECAKEIAMELLEMI